MYIFLRKMKIVFNEKPVLVNFTVSHSDFYFSLNAVTIHFNLHLLPSVVLNLGM